MEYISIVEAQYSGEYCIRLTFNNGETGEVNLQSMIHKYPIAASLKDKSEFVKFHLDGWPTLAWDCGFDVDPEYLFELATGKSLHLKEPVLLSANSK